MTAIKVQNRWELGWLKKKPPVFNPMHEWYNPTIDKILHHLKRGQNIIILVVGTPRSGKSAFSLWLQCYFNYCYFARTDYAPERTNLYPLNDVYWKIKGFIRATQDPENQNKFITLEEQGAEQYKMDFLNKSSGLQDFDKLQQIFGVDNTNLIINLPYIFDIQKGTRLKAHMLISMLRRSKTKVNAILCRRRINIVTDKASYIPTRTVWNNVPFVGDIYPDMYAQYEKLKKKYNADKKAELAKDKVAKGGFW